MNELQVKPLRGYSEEPRFYVYLHKRKDGSVFYVGKGSYNRAYVSKARNQHWQNVVNKNGGFEVEIIADNLKEQEAFSLEAETIKLYGIDNLVNQTLGGISTTGMVHSEETRLKQSQIAKERLINNPAEYDRVINQMKKLNETQGRDFQLKAIEAANAAIRKMTPEQHAKYVEKKTRWQKDPEKLAASHVKRKAREDYPALLIRMSEGTKARWANMTDEERNIASERSRKLLTSPEHQAKLDEFRCKSIVVNRKYIFKSITDFCLFSDSAPGAVTASFNTSKKQGFEFAVFKHMFIEYYDENIHSECKGYEEGQIVGKLDFDCLPRSKAVVTDTNILFLSMSEAAIFVKGKTVDATADFITKRMRQGKPAMGYYWRVASKDEVSTEILTRLDKMNSNQTSSATIHQGDKCQT
jgi:hypothetical protein